MADLRRLIRLHLSLARMAALMRAAKGASHDTPGSPSKTADRLSSNSSAAVPVAKAQDRQHAALANGDMARISAGAAAAARDSVNENGGRVFASGTGRSWGSAPLTWQAQEGSGIVHVSAVGPDCAILVVTPPTEAAEAGGPPYLGSAAAATGRADTADADPQQQNELPQLSITVEWVAGKQQSSAGSGSVSVGCREAVQGSGPGGIRCRMSATPSLPASMLEAFADMAGALVTSCLVLNVFHLLHALLCPTQVQHHNFLSLIVILWARNICRPQPVCKGVPILNGPFFWCRCWRGGAAAGCAVGVQLRACCAGR